MSRVSSHALAAALICLLGCGSHAASRVHKVNSRKVARTPSAGAGSSAADGDAAVLADAADAMPMMTSSSAILVSAPNDAGMPPANRDFDSAEPVELGETGVWQNRFHATQADYFVFVAEQPGFFVLMTEVNPLSPDNTIALFDAAENEIAENDVGTMWPGDRIDARLVVRLMQPGRYFVKIEDRSTLDYRFDPSTALPHYHFSVRAVTEGTPGFAFDAESAGDTAQPFDFTEDPASKYRFVTVLGELSLGDHDVFAFDGHPAQVLDGEILASGASGNGSTASWERLRVLAAEQRLLAEIASARGQRYLHPPIQEGSYQLALNADGDQGDNGFYAIDLVLLPDNPEELADQGNDQISGAEPITLSGGGFTRRGLLLSRLPAGDVDYFEFSAGAQERVGVVCESESGGSGVRGLRAELRDRNDELLDYALEMPAENLAIDGYVLPAADSYYLRLSAETPAQDTAEPWVRCAVLVGP